MVFTVSAFTVLVVVLLLAAGGSLFVAGMAADAAVARKNKRIQRDRMERTLDDLEQGERT